MIINSFEKYIHGGTKLRHKIWLVFGADEGGVVLTTEKLLKYISASYYNTASENVDVVRYDYSQIKDNVQLIQQESANMGLFAKFKIIVVTQCAEGAIKEIKELENQSYDNVCIVFVAKELKKSSKLRQFFTSAKILIGINCYKEDRTALIQFIGQYLNQQNVRYASGVLQMLATILPSDKMLIQKEVDKLVLYKSTDPAQNIFISTQDVTDLVQDASEIALDTLCYTLALKKQKLFIHYLQKIQKQNVNHIFMLRVLQSYFANIIKCKQYLRKNSNSNIMDAIANLHMPLFGQQKDNFITAANGSRLDYVVTMYKELIDLEIQTKRLYIEPLIIIGNSLCRTQMQSI